MFNSNSPNGQQVRIDASSAQDVECEKCGSYFFEPVVVIKKNNFKPLVVVDADYFIKLHGESDVSSGQVEEERS